MSSNSLSFLGNWTPTIIPPPWVLLQAFRETKTLPSNSVSIQEKAEESQNGGVNAFSSSGQSINFQKEPLWAANLKFLMDASSSHGIITTQASEYNCMAGSSHSKLPSTESVISTCVGNRPASINCNSECDSFGNSAIGANHSTKANLLIQPETVTLSSIMERGDAERGFGCPHCAKCFTSNSGLKQHMHIHASFKPFTCQPILLRKEAVLDLILVLRAFIIHCEPRGEFVPPRSSRRSKYPRVKPR
ncbi:hypothetical protein PHET_07313 [Paragonimus heterotremus]|uniref:C2H2-type domain-containing protein n=1 Tax=Paragonimus heterotremus TaxID=100268 RepID=A0A8J4SFG9_9TREM|nr:hypothetical protein PHET_07313 [Paragonimus heterotremus]